MLAGRVFDSEHTVRPLFRSSPRPRVWALLLAWALLWAAPGVRAESAEAPGLVSRVAWFLPNRVMDAVDVFRARVKLGPGLGAGARITDALSFYGGRSHAYFVGLPGPRGELGTRPPWGREDTRGLVVMGLDATDDLPYSPMYEFSESGFSLHLLLAGAEVTVSPVEFWDFAAGWVGADPSGDDFPRKPAVPPISFPRPMLGEVSVDPLFPLDPKPERFSGLSARLDFVADNTPPLVRSRMRALDLWLAGGEDRGLEQPPVGEFRLSMRYQVISGPDGSQDFKPKIKLDLELPNASRRLSLFIQSSYDEDLPGVDERERRDQGFTVGLRRRARKWNISADVGIHTKWVPELFARVAWKPRWQWDQWKLGFEQRLFWENEDGFGLLSALRGYRWLGRDSKWVARSIAAGRFSEASRGYEWQHTWTLGYMHTLVDERLRDQNLGLDDTLQCLGLNLSVFGSDLETTQYRSTVVFRKPVYKDFVVFEVEPGLQWREDRDWTTQYRLDTQLLLIF